MKREFDKQKLTAYALGELSGAEAREVEEALAADPALKRHVDELRAVSRLAEQDLRGEPLPGGRGAEPVLREIARRAAARPPARRAWAQAIALGALIVLFTLAVPLRHQFGGNVAKLFGWDRTEYVNDGTEEVPVHRTKKEDPAALTRDIEALSARRGVERSVTGCRFRLPEPGAGDRVRAEEGGFSAAYFLTDSGLEVDVLARAEPQPLVHEEGVEEVARGAGAALFRRVTGEQSVVYYVVPDKSSEPFCSVQVSSDWQLPEASRKAIGPALDGLAKSLVTDVAPRK